MHTLGRIALHILAHCTCEYQPRVLCTCSRPCFNILRTSPVHSGSSSARAWRSSFLLLAAHGFLTSSSFPGGKTAAAVNGASAPHFRPRDHKMGTMVPLCSRAPPPPAPWNPSPPARVPRSAPPNGRSSIPWNRKYAQKSPALSHASGRQNSAGVSRGGTAAKSGARLRQRRRPQSASASLPR